MVRSFLAWMFLILVAPFAAALGPVAKCSQTRTVHHPTLAPQSWKVGQQEIELVGPGGRPSTGNQEALAAEPSDTTLVNSWTSGTDQIVVTTQRSANESPEAQVKRHVATVKAMKAAFPPNPPPDAGQQ